MEETAKGVNTDGMYTEAQQKLMDRLSEMAGSPEAATEEDFIRAMGEVEVPVENYEERLREFTDVADNLGFYNLGAKLSEQAKAINRISEQVQGKSVEEAAKVLANDSELKSEFGQEDLDSLIKISFGGNESYSEKDVDKIVDLIHRNELNRNSTQQQAKPIEEDLNTEPIVVAETLNADANSKDPKHPIKVPENAADKLVYMEVSEKEELYNELKKAFKATKHHKSDNRIFSLAKFGENSLKNYLKDRESSIIEYQKLIERLENIKNPTSKTNKMIKKAKKCMEQEENLKRNVEIALEEKNGIKTRKELSAQNEQVSRVKKLWNGLKIQKSKTASLKRYYNMKKETKALKNSVEDLENSINSVLNSLKEKNIKTLAHEEQMAEVIERLISDLEKETPDLVKDLKKKYETEISPEIENKKILNEFNQKLEVVRLALPGLNSSISALETLQQQLEEILNLVPATEFNSEAKIYSGDYIHFAVTRKKNNLNKAIQESLSKLGKTQEKEQPNDEPSKEEQSSNPEDEPSKEEPLPNPEGEPSKEEQLSNSFEKPEKDKEESNDGNHQEYNKEVERMKALLLDQQQKVQSAIQKIKEQEEINHSLTEQLAEAKAQQSTQNMENTFAVDTTQLEQKYTYEVNGLNKKLSSIDSELNRCQKLADFYLDGTQFEKLIEDNKEYTIYLENVTPEERKAMITEWSNQYAREVNQPKIEQMNHNISKLENEKKQVEFEIKQKEIEHKKKIAAEKEAKLKLAQKQLEQEKQQIYAEELEAQKQAVQSEIKARQEVLKNNYDIHEAVQLANQIIDNQPLALPNDLESNNKTR
ncbi:MAG: hypothetical protein KH135_01055 [Firmicutes bacterium]|nr:hypothetical protein [Bacillota bacterium]